ncbi:MAG: acyl-CoA/acyl-ACP dehydrogenase [Deltaproteobacteria bacterium]|nr:acyl-CoA/acyl-ACP dehydrogenase [Deltaproteobacteria bacterium]
MDLNLNIEQSILKDSARDFLKAECPKSLVREVREWEDDYPEELWHKMAEMGWMGVLIPEEYDGIGGDFLDLTILIEVMGQACLPAPFFSTVVIGGTALLLAGSKEQKKDLLPKIIAGELVVSYALIEPGNWYGFSNVNTSAVEEGDSYIISGTKLFVEYARSANYILCAARVANEGLALFLVKADNPSIKMKLFNTLSYDYQCEVVFEDVKVPKENLLSLGQPANDLLATLEERGALAKCAEMLGCMQPAFEMSLAYAKEREQFGRLIGTFQAIQHHCVNMVIDLNSARYITYLAAWKIAQGLPAAKEAAMAKSYTSAASNRVIKLGHQIHGAISYCDEHDMHLFYRKAKAASIAFGDTDHHLEKVAQHLGL